MGHALDDDDDDDDNSRPTHIRTDPYLDNQPSSHPLCPRLRPAVYVRVGACLGVICLREIYCEGGRLPVNALTRCSVARYYFPALINNWK